MTDNEIIKAMECCSSGACTEACPQDSCKYHDCMEQLMKNALDLIQRQQERMDRIVELLEELQNHACFPNEWVNEEQGKIHSYYADKLTEILHIAKAVQDE